MHDGEHVVAGRDVVAAAHLEALADREAGPDLGRIRRREREATAHQPPARAARALAFAAAWRRLPTKASTTSAATMMSRPRKTVASADPPPNGSRTSAATAEPTASSTTMIARTMRMLRAFSARLAPCGGAMRPMSRRMKSWRLDG